jgi:hypothetical protein
VAGYCIDIRGEVVFVTFLRRLLSEGSVVLSAPPVLRREDRGDAAALLAAAFADHALDVAGPPIAFDTPVALAAAECVAKACWFLVSRDEQADAVGRALVLPPEDVPAAHLSADVVLRFLPSVHRRARVFAPDDVLTAALATMLRQWPLSGALADVADPPLTAPTFGGHPGLLLLYAERLASHEKTAWVTDGPVRPFVELVFAERGLRLPAPAGQEVSVAR